MSVKVNSVRYLQDKILEVVDNKWVHLHEVQERVNNLTFGVSIASIESICFVCGILYMDNKLNFRNHTTEDEDKVKYFMVRSYM